MVMRYAIQLVVIAALVMSASCGVLDQFFPPDPAASHAIPPFTIEPDLPGVAYERFMAIGDMGTGLVGQHNVAAAMAQRAAEDGLDFVITVGDNIYPSGVSSATNYQWKLKFESVYDAPSLQVPFFPTLGNHDHDGSAQAQVDYSAHNSNWQMPAQYYTYMRHLTDGTTAQFFALDTTPINEREPGSDDQLAWLDEQLAQSSARWKIVYGHHPLYGHNPERWNGERMIVSLEALFVEHEVDLYLAGHDHILEMLKPVNGVLYVISGGGGGGLTAAPVEWTEESYYAGTGGGFVLIRISWDALDIEFVRTNAVTQYAFRVTKAD